MIVLRGVLTCKLACNTAMISYYSTLAGMSPAVMLSMVALTSFTTAITFYFIYGEKLLIQQMVGMATIILSVVVIAVSKSLSMNSTPGDNP